MRPWLMFLQLQLHCSPNSIPTILTFLRKTSWHFFIFPIPLLADTESKRRLAQWYPPVGHRQLDPGSSLQWRDSGSGTVTTLSGYRIFTGRGRGEEQFGFGWYEELTGGRTWVRFVAWRTYARILASDMLVNGRLNAELEPVLSKGHVNIPLSYTSSANSCWDKKWRPECHSFRREEIESHHMDEVWHDRYPQGQTDTTQNWNLKFLRVM